MKTRSLTLRFFAGARDAVGLPSLTADFGPELQTIRDLMEWLGHRYPLFGEVAGRLLIARNLKYTNPDAPLADGDEIAFFPPVSGG
jgi:molybdopterin synthase sulfur carrier subunit